MFGDIEVHDGGDDKLRVLERMAREQREGDRSPCFQDALMSACNSRAKQLP